MIKVLLVDDHLIVRQGLRQVLADAPGVQVVDEAANGADAVRLVRDWMDPAEGPGLDVVMLDIAMPGRDGLDVLKQIKAEFPRLGVIMLSTYPDRQFAVRCLRAGAQGYLNKSADPDDMLAAVRKAAGGAVFVSQATAEALAAAVGSAAAQAGPEALSHREYQVYRLLTQGRTVSEIGAQLGLAANTVSTYRSRILEKTGTKNDVELALYAQRHGAAR